MDRLKLLQTFVAVVDAGSFTAAADHIGGDPKLVSKHIAALEAAYRLRLFNRTTRALSVTEAGRRLYDAALDLLARHDDLEAAVHDDATLVAGRLRLSAPVAYGEAVLLPVLRDFLDRHPRLVADVRMTDRFVDLSEEGFDLAIRIGGSELSALVARQIGLTRMILVAAPALVAEWGQPTSIEDLARYPQIGDSNFRGGQVWPLVLAGKEATVPVRSRITVNSAGAAARLAADGEGIALTPDYVAQAMLSSGSLIQVLEEVCGPSLPIRVVFQDGRRLPLRVRRFIEVLAQR